MILLFRVSLLMHRCYCFTASGVLKGYDPLLNLVLDGCTEYLRGNFYEFIRGMY